MADWTELSDDELRTRLEQRQVATFVAQWLVVNRDMPNGIATIDNVLGGSR